MASPTPSLTNPNPKREGANQARRLTVNEPTERSADAIYIHDEDDNDIATFFHSEHATVGQDYETALRLATLLVEANNGGASAPALHDDERDLTDEDRIAYWKGAYDRMAARNIELGRQVSELSQPQQGAGRALADIAAERRRQTEAEGWSPQHDDEHDAGALAAAGAAYALNAADQLDPHSQGAEDNYKPNFWPFEAAWWKPSDPRRDLVKSGALTVAEIEKIDRAATATATEVKL